MDCRKKTLQVLPRISPWDDVVMDQHQMYWISSTPRMLEVRMGKAVEHDSDYSEATGFIETPAPYVVSTKSMVDGELCERRSVLDTLIARFASYCA